MKRLILAAALAAATLSAPAYAASDNFKMELTYSGKNLATRTGAEQEYEYIRKQVAERCQAEQSDLGFVGGYAQTYCVRKTLSRAVNSIGNPMLTDVHEDRR
ncbi:UrcA family protein [Hyphomonas sp.]|uniref:UrcA family protein n=1 Tax=Hyphomonas sp. TaxID=87 RepID=UPI001BCCB6DF|nr:UrcA family protein [Hyphomonas sp.]